MRSCRRWRYSYCTVCSWERASADATPPDASPPDLTCDSTIHMFRLMDRNSKSHLVPHAGAHSDVFTQRTARHNLKFSKYSMSRAPQQFFNRPRFILGSLPWTDQVVAMPHLLSESLHFSTLLQLSNYFFVALHFAATRPVDWMKSMKCHTGRRLKIRTVWLSKAVITQTLF